ncbi:MAG: transporter substrate-binding domain-containing protein [Deltaproteobacteria bacterium]|nr:transporter substrate-binding domain-containing protein [Deltaproteobacteria bacterium]MBW2123062.1 transporter substrate-binding domain-containing protein [Deltaproteobacteria bacterium]
MKRLGTVWFLGFLVIVLAFGVSIAQARSLDQIIKAGEIRVGINPTLPPLGLFNEKNEIDGFDKDFAVEIAKKLGVKLKVVRVGSPDRIPFVAADKIDFVMGAMTRNSARAKIIDFTLPITTEAFGVLTTKKIPYENYKEFNRKDITFVQVRGTTPIPFIQKNLPKAKILLLDNYPDVIRAIAQGRADAMIDVIDYMWKYMKTHKQVKWKVIKTPVEIYFNCLGVAKGNYTLRDWLNVAIYELYRDGVVDRLWEKWFGGPIVFKVHWSEWF